MKNYYSIFSRLFLTIISLTFIVNYSSAQGSQLRNPGTAASVTGAPCGTTAWTSPASATGVISDGIFARSVPAVNTNSACLELTTAGFSIPAGSTIIGIVVNINRTTNRANTNDANVQLIKGGSKIGTNKAIFNNWPQAATTVTYGGASDLWGTTWTAADINAANFGFSFAATRVGGTTAPNIDVDGIEITVYYSLQVSGTVFRDYNSNGVINNGGGINEKGVSGITVNATLPDGTSVTTTTDANGFYSFTSAQIPTSTNVRLEFLNLTNGDFSSATGSDNNSSVQFINTTNPVIANYGINTPDDYWNNTAQSNPKLLAISYAHGDINHTNSAITSYGILQLDNNTTGHTPTLVNVATQTQVGSLWGMGYQKNHDRYFFANFLKRHVGFGPKGVGGVYMANLSGANYALSGSFTLQGVVPSNTATALDMGTVNRVSTPNTSDFYLATGSDAQGKDLDAFGKAGKVGFGDIEVDDKNQQLVLVNLNQRRIITVDVSGNTAALNNASAATLSPLTRAYDILSLPGIPSYNTSTQGHLRPFALKIYKGRGYLGITGDASVTPRDSTNLIGYILSFDPANIAAGFTTEITLNFNYRTSTSNGNTNRWHSWADVWSDVRSSGLYRYPEPLISDIEFDENGGMNISISDRFCHQMGVSQTEPVAGSATVIGEARESGDLLHVCRVGSSWIMEGSAGSCNPANTVDNTDGYGDGQTVGVREWYDDQSGDNSTGEFTQGAIAKLMGSNLLVQTMQDPTSGPNTTGEPYYYSAGMHWFNVNTGGWTNWTSVYDGSDAGNPGGGFMKGNGLGDIEFATNPQPIQIGNRIWLDTNGNGIQDADEITAGVPTGTTVTLRSPGVDGIYGNADDQTWTTTTNATGNYYFSTLSSADNRKPASWTGVGNTLLPGYNYRIEVGVPTSNSITLADMGTNDNIDNDAIQISNTAYVNFNTANTNHNFDIGFWKPNSLGNKVWRDDNSNGAQDAGEPGVAGITVTLYANGADGNPGTTDDIIVGTTTTDAYGNYLFTNLPDGNYNVKFTLPNNYIFTSQGYAGNAAGDNQNNTNSDPSTTTGRTGTINLTAGATGETDLTIDAGIIFTQPTALSSIGDKVWYDTNGDGIQDISEAGVAGVTVTLYDAGTGNIIAVTTTDGAGKYIFNNLPNGNYQVGFTPLPGTLLTQNNGGTTTGNATTNSDADPVWGRTGTITIAAAGTVITGIDAGLKDDPKASLGDFVWNDLNANGIQDAGEPGVSGVAMTLYFAGADGVPGGGDDVLIQRDTTDANGYYLFSNLDQNVYFVTATLPTGYSVTTKDVGTDDYKDSDFGTNVNYPSVQTSGTYSLLTGQNYLGVDMGIKTNTAGLGSIGDKVWMDTNGNGLQDVTELGVAGVTVSLLDGSGNPVNNPATGKPYVLLTDSAGNYKFVDLPAGNYQVKFTNLPVGTSFTSQDASGSGTPGSGTDGANDSDVNPATGKTATITLGAGQNITSVDAGLIPSTPSGKGSLGNKVWIDADNDGIQDANEQGVPNVTVELYFDSNNDGVISGAEATTPFKSTLTDGQGNYMFTGLDAGLYQVKFVTTSFPSGYALQTGKNNVGTNDATDSDADPTTGLTGTYILAQGEDNLTVDAGLFNTTATNSIGDRVWVDTNSDGKQDAGESGVAGVTVNLIDNTGKLIASVVTDANGNYFFGNLPNGSYSVQVVPPAGYTLTTQNGTASGTTAANNSDFNASTGRTPTVSLTGSTNITDLDAGLINTRAALGDKVWYDVNGNGTQDGGVEVGIAGVTVTLFRPGFGLDGIAGNADDALPVATAITDANGNYLFPNLIPGDYQVAFTTIPSGLEFTQQNTAGDNQNNTNSDPVPSTGRTGTITISAGETDLTVDAGLRPMQVGGVGDFVWNDANNNGIQDAGEAGVPGVIVTLKDNLGNVVGTTVTDGNGNYLFTNVPAGTGYTMTFSNLPPGASLTTQTNGTATGSDANQATGITPPFTVTAGQINRDIDAGIRNFRPLPVRIVSFTAQPQGSQVNLQWTVTEQSSIAKYEVEFSADGRNYSSIANVLANTLSNTTYNAIHTNPVAGINFYRIKIVERDGSFSYSEIRKVNFSKVGTISIYPNPTVEIVNITLSQSFINKPLVVSIISMDGKVVATQKVAAASQTETINVSNLAAGKYMLRIITDNDVITKSVEVIR